MSSSLIDDPSTWRLQTPTGGVPYRVKDREGGFEEEAADLVETYIIQASRLEEFLLDAFPTPLWTGDAIIYPRPLNNGTPLVPQRARWKALVDGKPVDPFGADPTAPAGTYGEFLELQVTYGTGKTKEPTEDDEGNPDPYTFLEISADAGGQFLHSNAPGGAWEDDRENAPTDDDQEEAPNQLITTPVQVVVPETQWSVTFPQVPYHFYSRTLIARLRAALGKVNSVPMPIFFGAPPETILFLGYSMQQQFTWRTRQQPPFKVVMKFAEKHVQVDETYTPEPTDDDPEPEPVPVTAVKGHNHAWKADVGWQRLKYDGTNYVYTTHDLNKLFRLQ